MRTGDLQWRDIRPGRKRRAKTGICNDVKVLAVDGNSINILVPIPGTPLEKNPEIGPEEVLRAIAMVRICNPERMIKLAAGRNGVLASFQALILYTMANGFITGDLLTVPGFSIQQDRIMTNFFRNL